MVTTESGLQYKDIKVGQGPSPPVGFQVCNYLIRILGMEATESFFPRKCHDTLILYLLLPSR